MKEQPRGAGAEIHVGGKHQGWSQPHCCHSCPWGIDSPASPRPPVSCHILLWPNPTGGWRLEAGGRGQGARLLQCSERVWG